MNIKDLKAKTEQQGGTSLCDHTVMSINVANALYNRFLNTKCISDELPGLYEQSLYTTGFHDLLKVMDSLQKYYVKFLSGTKFSLLKKEIPNSSSSRKCKGNSTICPIILFLFSS